MLIIAYTRKANYIKIEKEFHSARKAKRKNKYFTPIYIKEYYIFIYVVFGYEKVSILYI